MPVMNGQQRFAEGMDLDPEAMDALIKRYNPEYNAPSRARAVLEQLDRLRNTPQDAPLERSIDPALVSSLTQASAQLGTIGGKAPSTAPVDQFGAMQEQRYNSSLAAAAKRRQADEHFGEQKLKTAMFEDTMGANERRARAMEDRQQAMDTRQEQRDINNQENQDRNYQLNKTRTEHVINKPEKPETAQDTFKKLPMESQIEIKTVASKTATKNMMANLMAQQLQTMGDAIAAGDKDQAIKSGQLMLKNLNSPDGGRDAIQAAEEERIGGLLKFQKGNLTEPGQFLGRDIAGFYKMAAHTVNGIRRSVADDKARMEQIQAGNYNQNTPEMNPEPPMFGSGPRQHLEPEIIRGGAKFILNPQTGKYKKAQ